MHDSLMLKRTIASAPFPLFEIALWINESTKAMTLSKTLYVHFVTAVS